MTDSNAVINQRAESNVTHWHPRDLISVCAAHTPPSIESGALLTNQIRTWKRLFSQKCSNVESNTQQRVGVMTNFMSLSTANVIVNVMESDAVFWWAAIFRTASLMFGKTMHLSKTQCSSMSSLRSHNFREAVSDLLTVTMHIQDALSRFHRPGLHEVDLCVHVASASTCTVSLHEPSAAALSVHRTIVPDEQLHILLHSSLVAIPSQAPPASAINSDSPELEQTMFCFLEKHTQDTTCFQRNP